MIAPTGQAKRMRRRSLQRVVALAGGVGGAKLAEGLSHLLDEALTVVVNTADDFTHLGFHISPDLDTVMYTLAGIANAQTGWGVADESWNFLEQAARLGGPTWFRLGDRDLATHAMRTEKLRAGEPLSSVTKEFARALGVKSEIVPMTDDPVRTVVLCGGDRISFQDYFVRFRAEPRVSALSFEGAQEARPSPPLSRLMQSESVDAVVICPSNPYLSIDPILAVPGVRSWIESIGAPVLAVSPIVAGAAIKGPAAKIMVELGVEASALSVAQHYAGLISGLVIDEADAPLAATIEGRRMAARVERTIMRSAEDRVRLASTCLAFSDALRAA